MTKRIKVGIVGQIRSGKSTVGKMLNEELGAETVEFAFSDGIHRVIEDNLPELYKDGKPRGALQEIGQLFRKFVPDVWINKIFTSDRYTLADMTETNIIITDVRQYNEIARLKEEGFILLKVTADSDERFSRALDSGDNFNYRALNHETELQADQAKADVQIDNSGSLKELRRKVKTFIQAYAGKEADQ